MQREFSRRSLLASGAVVAGAASLAGCSPKPETTELVVWQTETDIDAIARINKVKSQFEIKHPGVTVTIESVPWGTLATKLNAAIQSGALPDISHLEPFMTYSLVRKGMLTPISDLVTELDKGGRIFDAVRRLQYFDGEYYGLAYAVGVTGWAFDTRKSGGLPLPYPADDRATITTDQFLAYAKAVKRKTGTNGVLLPGGSPFFIDQLVGELLANAGGTFYDPAKRQWLFTGAPMQRVLEFLLALKTGGVLDPSWVAQTYPDQFPRLAKRDGTFVTPVTYARAAVAIRKELAAESRPQDGNDNIFRFMSPPLFPNSGVAKPIATIDCEPYVLLAEPAKRLFNGKPRRELSIDFLRMFYQRDNYIAFAKTVPIHLTPVFKDIAADPEYLSSIAPWTKWHEHTLRYLNDENATRPILIPGHQLDTREAEFKNPYLLDLSAQNIISNGVARLLTDPKAKVSAVQQEMQERATRLITA